MKIRLALILCTLLASLHSQAQAFSELSEKPDFKKAFKILPINAATQEFIVGYEHQITERSSLEFYAFYNQFSVREAGFGATLHNPGLSAGYRYYFTKKEDQLEGFYGRASLRGEYDGENATLTQFFTLGLETYVGYQWELDSFLKGFVIDLSGGVFANQPITNKQLGGNRNNISVDPRIVFSIGYSF